MASTPALRVVLVVLSLATASVCAKEPVPVVYEDDFLTLRAGLPELGATAVHLGDSLSLVIDVVFDARQVRIENIDDDVFHRAFSATPSIRLNAPTIVTTRQESGDRVRLTSYWRLQVLDCPDELTSCPGSRSYELPVITVAYQLIDDAGGTADGRAARFRPWPGKIDVASAIAVRPEPGMTIADILPGGAYDRPLAVAELAPARSTLIVAGALLLLAGFLGNARQRQHQPLAARSLESNSRWEQALDRLKNDAMPDDEWCDLLRRCVTWYCMDELGQNPFAWLDKAIGGGDAQTGASEFFLDILQQESIDTGRRADYLNRLLRVTGRVRQ